MNKKIIYLFLFSIILLGVGINISHQAFIWGIETTSSADELDHFSRANAIAYGYTDLRHEYDNTDFFDFYPSGLHIAIAEFTILSDFYPAYITSLVFRTIYSLIVGVVMFLIGSKINWKVGIFSSFFSSTFIQVLTSNTYYIYLSSWYNYLTTGVITVICTLFVLLFYILYFKNKDNDPRIGLLIVIFGTIHGISHISTYIGFIVNFIAFSLFILPLVFFRYKYLFIKLLNIILYSILSLPAVFFIYYLPMYPEVLSPTYLPEKFFPSFVPSHYVNFFPIIFSLMFIFILILLIILDKYSKKGAISYFKTNKYIFIGMLGSYITLYGLVLLFVTKNPQKYNFSGFAILAGIFPTYLPHSYNGVVSLASISVGFIMFGLTVLAFVFTYNYSSVNIYFILILFFSFYVVWFMFAIIIKYYADRIIYFKYILPLIYGIGLVSFFSHKRLNSKYGKLTKKIAVLGIVFLFLSMTIISQITKEPPIRQELEINRIEIGSRSVPIMLSSFSYEVNRITERGEYVLATPLTLEAISATSHTRSPTNHWSQSYIDHTNWSITINAIRGRSLEVFFEKYNANYLIVGFRDVVGPIIYFSNSVAPISTYNKNPNLRLIYVDQYGERIYEWI